MNTFILKTELFFLTVIVQVKELISHQEAERKNQEMSHSEKMESLKLQYEASVEGGKWHLTA